MNDDFDRDPVAAALRASLARHADDAPAADPLAERILAGAARPPAHGSRVRSWRTWTLPLVAATAVGVVVLAVVGIERYRPPAEKELAGTSTSAPVARPSTPRPSPTTTASTTRPVDSTDLRAVRVIDLTFVGENDGWALASAECVSGPGRCTALLRTTDGSSWRSMPGAAFNVAGVKSCADPCVDHVRFANDQIGYAFGREALFVTHDGGGSWSRQPGLGATALETLNGNVIRYDRGHLARAAIGSTTWSSIGLPGGTPSLTAGGVYLARAEHVVIVLLTPYDPAKGYDQPATLYRSVDDGVTWHRRADPCPAIGAGYSHDSVGLAVGADGSVVIACVGRNKTQTVYGGSTITSTDGGQTFVEPSATGKLGPATVLGAADANHQFVYAAISGRGTELPKRFYSSAGPLPWNLLPDITGEITFVGFESTSVGRVVADGGRTIWTTHDAGRTWRPVTLP